MNTAAENENYEGHDHDGFDSDTFSGPGPITQGDGQGFIEPNQPALPGFQAPTGQPPVQSDPNTPTNVTPMFTMDQVMQMMARSAPPVQSPSNQPPPPPQMTPEQVAAHLKQFAADDAFATGFINALQPGEDGRVDPAKVRDTINALVTGVRQEVLRALELNNETVFGEVDSRYGHAATFVQQQKEDRAWASFAATYPQLSSVRQLVDAKVKQIGNNFPPGTTREQAFAFVANSVAQDLAAMGIDANKLPVPPAQAPRNTRVAPQQHAPAPFVPGYPTLGNPATPLLAPVTPGLPARGGRGAPQHRQQQTNPYYDNDTFAR